MSDGKLTKAAVVRTLHQPEGRTLLHLIAMALTVMTCGLLVSAMVSGMVHGDAQYRGARVSATFYMYRSCTPQPPEKLNCLTYVLFGNAGVIIASWWVILKLIMVVACMPLLIMNLLRITRYNLILTTFSLNLVIVTGVGCILGWYTSSVVRELSNRDTHVTYGSGLHMGVTAMVLALLNASVQMYTCVIHKDPDRRSWLIFF